MADVPVLAEARNPEGRLVQLHSSTWDHVLDRHPAMVDHLDETMSAIARPQHREPDPRPGRERYFRRGGPQAWIRVVTELVGTVDRVVTAFPQRNDPLGRSGQ